jgi:hypothetical protein
LGRRLLQQQLEAVERLHDVITPWDDVGVVVDEDLGRSLEKTQYPGVAGQTSVAQ